MDPKKLPVDASKSDARAPEQEQRDIEAEIAALEIEIQEFTQQRDHAVNEVKRLRAEENPLTEVYYPKEIFEQQQNKLRLDVEIDIRRKKINRRKLALDPSLFF